MLDGGDVNDHATAALDHVWHQRPVQPHGGQQIQVQLFEPEIIRQGGKASARRMRAAEVMNEDVHTTLALRDLGRHCSNALRRREISGDETCGQGRIRRRGPGGRDHSGSCCGKPAHHGLARALRASADQDTLPGELGGMDGEGRCVHWMERRLILSLATAKV